MEMVSSKSKSILFLVGILACVSCNNEIKKRIPLVDNASIQSEVQKSFIQEAYDKAKSNLSSDNLGYLGMVYYSSNYYDEAKTCFDLALKVDEKKWEWSYYKGMIHMELGEAIDAKNSMRDAIGVKPNNWMAWYRLADIYRQMDSIPQAINALKKITSLSDSDTKIVSSLRSTYFPLQLHSKVLLSKIYMSEGNNVKAEQTLYQVISRFKSFGPAYKQLSILYANMQNTSLAKKYTDRANDLIVYNEPLDTLKDKLALMTRSETYVLKEIDNAMRGTDAKWSNEVLRKAIKNVPDSKYVISKAISQYLAKGTVNLALYHVDKHFDAFKDDYNEILNTGVKLADAGLKSEAKKYLKHAMTFGDLTAQNKANLAGIIFEKLGKEEEAKNIFESLIENNEANHRILEDALFFMLQTQNKKKAYTYYKQLKKVKPKSTGVYIYEAFLLEKSGNINKAINIYRKAFSVASKNKFLILKLQSLVLEKKDWKMAKSFFKEALKSNPNDSELQTYLGWLLVSYPDDKFKAQEIEEGIEFSERAFYNSNYKVHNKITAGRTLGVGYHLKGNDELATYYLNRTIAFAIRNKGDKNYIQGLRSLVTQFQQKGG